MTWVCCVERHAAAAMVATHNSRGLSDGYRPYPHRDLNVVWANATPGAQRALERMEAMLKADQGRERGGGGDERRERGRERTNDREREPRRSRSRDRMEDRGTGREYRRGPPGPTDSRSSDEPARVDPNPSSSQYPNRIYVQGMKQGVLMHELVAAFSVTRYTTTYHSRAEHNRSQPRHATEGRRQGNDEREVSDSGIRRASVRCDMQQRYSCYDTSC